jgi:hypothetical protein
LEPFGVFGRQFVGVEEPLLDAVQQSVPPLAASKRTKEQGLTRVRGRFGVEDQDLIAPQGRRLHITLPASTFLRSILTYGERSNGHRAK